MGRDSVFDSAPFVGYEEVRAEGSYVVALVADFEFGLGYGGDGSEFEVLEEGAFVDFFEEAGAEGVGYFEGGAEDLFDQRVFEGEHFSGGAECGDFSGFFCRDGLDGPGQESGLGRDERRDERNGGCYVA